MMNRVCLAIALVILVIGPIAPRERLLAQGADSTCGGGTALGTVLRLALPGHDTLALVRNADSLDYEDVCEARVSDSGGKIAWRRSGFWAWLDGWTGHDVNGDGRPDAVIVVDVGGGNRCCRESTILGLGVTVDSITTLQFSPLFAVDSLGRTVIFETLAFYDLGEGEADAPVLSRVFQFRDGGLARVTAEYCTGLLTDTTQRRDRPWHPDHPSAAARAASRAVKGKVPYEAESTRVAVVSLALQYLECGRRDEALHLVRETWPEAEADAQFARVENAWEQRRE
jgi:hypothetical protein